MTYLIYVSGLLHNVTSRRDEHEAYAARLTQAGRDVTTKEEN